MEQLTADDPRWIGQYRLLRRLGSGGMGRVYLGRTAGGRTVAVKRVHADLASDTEFRARFRQEVAAARRVGGRWTAPVFDADTEGPQPWVATGYVAGPSLQAAVRDFGPLPPASVRALGTGLAEALAAVHGLGLVHRDVKPSNVLLALDGPRLIDFGITRALDAAVQLTRTGLLVGSPGYLSPEQAQGTGAGPASDVFSLGAVLAFAAAGTPPFGDGQHVATLLYRVLHEAPDLSRLDPGLRALVAACMAKNPAERPTTEQVRAGLDAAGGDGVQLGASGWLPAAISASVGRLAVELLDLDSEPGTGSPADAQTQQNPAMPRQSAAAPQTFAATQNAMPPTATPPYNAASPQNPAPQTLSAHAGPQQNTPPQTFAAPQNATPPQTFAPPQNTMPPNTPPPTAFATMTGAMPPSFPPAPPPTAPRRRGPLIALSAVGVIAVAAVAIAVSLSSSSDSSSQQTNQPATSVGVATTAATTPAATRAFTAPSTPAAATSAVTSTGVIPAGYLGSWQGQITGDSLASPLAAVITIAQGRPGEQVGTITNDGGGGYICRIKTSLVSVDASRLVLRVIANSASAGCVPIMADQYYTLTGPDTMHLSLSTYQADLTRQ